MSSQRRLLNILLLFSSEEPFLSAEDIAARQSQTLSTTYRDLKVLRALGFVETARGDRFMLGGQISVLDRVARLSDPLWLAARPEMEDLALVTGLTVTLTRIYRDNVIGLGHVDGTEKIGIGYERGQLVPLFKGCTGKVILSSLGWRRLRRIFSEHHGEIIAAGLPSAWDEFIKTVRGYGGSPTLWTAGEINPDNVAGAAPLLEPGGEASGSLTIIIRKTSLEVIDRKAVDRALQLCAMRISEKLSR